MSPKLKHNGIYRSSNQKFFRGVVSGFTHKILFGSEKHIYLAYFLRVALIPFAGFIIFPYLLLGYLLKSKPTLDDGSDLSQEKESIFSRFNKYEEGGFFEKILAFMVKGTPADTERFGQVRGGFSNTGIGQKLAEIGQKGERELSVVNDVPKSTTSGSAHEHSNSSSLQINTPAVSGDDSSYPVPFAAGGAVITRFDHKTGEYQYQKKCDACSFTFGTEHGKTVPRTYHPPGGGTFICPKCSHRFSVKVGWEA